jgi:long-chain fatty acid transport protein
MQASGMDRIRRTSWLWLLIPCASVCLVPVARAGGFDTPILYTAKHMGMGGTAIGYVDDSSAVFHNPAGLQGVDGLAFVGDFSLLLGHLRASPDTVSNDDARSIESELTVAPFFMLGAAYRLHQWVTVGLALYPVASGGARYLYDSVSGSPVEDETEIVFVELSPAVSVNVPQDLLLPGELSLGIGYRYDLLQFGRTKGPPGNPAVIDLDLDGGASGFRVGLQWKPSETLGFGLVFRSRVLIEASAESATAVGQTVTDPELDFVLPAKLGLGSRFDLDAWGFAVDAEYGFYSQNGESPLRGELNGMPVPASIKNVYSWQDAITVRLGVEHRFGAERRWPVRVGYIFDGAVTDERYPSAFSTPPAPTHSLTAGAGYKLDHLEFDLAYAYRFGSATIAEEAVAPSSECVFCSSYGDYEIGLNGLYFSVTGDLQL